MLEVLPFVEDPDLSGSTAPALPQLLPPWRRRCLSRWSPQKSKKQYMKNEDTQHQRSYYHQHTETKVLHIIGCFVCWTNFELFDANLPTWPSRLTHSHNPSCDVGSSAPTPHSTPFPPTNLWKLLLFPSNLSKLSSSFSLLSQSLPQPPPLPLCLWPPRLLPAASLSHPASSKQQAAGLSARPLPTKQLKATTQQSFNRTEQQLNATKGAASSEENGRT